MNRSLNRMENGTWNRKRNVSRVHAGFLSFPSAIDARAAGQPDCIT
jgi:hypothetical protein